MANRSRWKPPHPAKTLKPPTSGLPHHRRCVWPDCRMERFETTPLCSVHLTVAAEIDRERKDETSRNVLSFKGYINPRPVVEAPTDASPEPAAEPGWVYMLRVGGFVKIGWTSDLSKRMRSYPPDTQLLAVQPGTRKDERALHRKFAHLLTHGREWFPLAPQITEHVDRVIAEHGAPPAVHFSARPADRIVGPRLNQYVGTRGRPLMRTTGTVRG